jgi:hypothetical protein
LFVPLLKHALDSWWRALLAIRTFSQEEKKQDEAACNDECISKLQETRTLHRVLQVHVAISRLDSTLAEEVGRQGSHALLHKLLVYNGHDFQTQDDQDCIMELQDFCCEIAACTGGAFPLKVSPFAEEDLRNRLPLSFHIHPVVNDGSESLASGSQLILINQVTTRQSAQEDVGFGKLVMT